MSLASAALADNRRDERFDRDRPTPRPVAQAQPWRPAPPVQPARPVYYEAPRPAAPGCDRDRDRDNGWVQGLQVLGAVLSLVAPATRYDNGCPPPPPLECYVPPTPAWCPPPATYCPPVQIYSAPPVCVVPAVPCRPAYGDRYDRWEHERYERRDYRDHCR